MIKVSSNSIGKLQKCARAYKYSYIDNLEPASLHMRALHAIQQLYQLSLSDIIASHSYLVALPAMLFSSPQQLVDEDDEEIAETEGGPDESITQVSKARLALLGIQC